jgi:hypothetical protein
MISVFVCDASLEHAHETSVGTLPYRSARLVIPLHADRIGPSKASALAPRFSGRSAVAYRRRLAALQFWAEFGPRQVCRALATPGYLYDDQFENKSRRRQSGGQQAI